MVAPRPSVRSTTDPRRPGSRSASLAGHVLCSPNATSSPPPPCTYCFRAPPERPGRTGALFKMTIDRFSSVYYSRGKGDFVRADVTYLKQDFSVQLPVANPGQWPAEQRYDFVVRERP